MIAFAVYYFDDALITGRDFNFIKRFKYKTPFVNKFF